MTTEVNFEVGQLYRVKGPRGRSMGTGYELSGDAEVYIGSEDVVLMIDHLARNRAWFIGLVKERLLVLAKDEFVKVKM